VAAHFARWRRRRRRRRRTGGVVLTRIRVVPASFDGGHVGMHNAVLFELVVALFVSNEGSRVVGLPCAASTSPATRPCALVPFSSFPALVGSSCRPPSLPWPSRLFVELGGGQCWRTWRDALVLGSPV
jgi:hypothetical protein